MNVDVHECRGQDGMAEVDNPGISRARESCACVNCRDEAVLDQNNGLIDTFQRSEQGGGGYRDHAKRTTILNGKRTRAR
jgi:hypothetical protein